jgi:Flp pilus assembly protein TadD
MRHATHRRGRGRRAAATLLGLAIAMLPAGLAPVPGDAQPRDDGARCEYGITLALVGQWARAESTFVALLSSVPADPRALTNLGNLHVLRGDYGPALAFYDAASARDTADAGIRLNRATTLMLMGLADSALSEAAAGVRRAGGPRAAASLLGVGTARPEVEEEKGAGQALVTRDEVRALLAAALDRVPADTLRGPAGPAPPAGRKKPPTWRSAGPRGADGSEVATVLYWKR